MATKSKKPRRPRYYKGERPDRCVHCGSKETKVTQTKVGTEPDRTIRYRKCDHCRAITATVTLEGN